VSGRIAFERTSLEPPADPTRVGIQLVEHSSAVLMVGITGRSSGNINFAMGNPSADGTFTIGGVAPGRYHVMSVAGLAAGPAGQWWLKSVTAGGRETIDDGFEVASQQDVSGIVLTFSDKTTSLAGRLLDSSGRAASGHFVFVFPADRRFWSPFSRRTTEPVRPSSDGAYRLKNLVPGDYFIVALTAFERDDLTDASFLEQLAPVAIRITLAEGEAKVQDLRIGR
jgi:hypothetical protein